jgi:hypothetical protein
MLKALELEGVDAGSVAVIGSSIGADGAADSCLWLNEQKPGACGARFRSLQAVTWVHPIPKSFKNWANWRLGRRFGAWRMKMKSRYAITPRIPIPISEASRLTGAGTVMNCSARV